MRRFLLALLLLSIAAASGASSLRYHGELLDNGAPANGRYDLQLTPYLDATTGAALGAPVVFEDVLVEDGFFLLEPEFDARVLEHRDIWIGLGVRDADSTLAFATLDARQKADLAPLVGQCWSTTGDSGVSAATNFLGTTDGAPLVLRSSGGIGINTAQVRDMLTLRGPDDPLTGPNITLTGTLSDQAESGRIRFVEGTAAGNQRGAYLRYDGVANLFAIGAHAASDADPANDTDHILVQRSATTRVGIGKVPGEVLDVEGDIRINGGVKYANAASHSMVFSTRAFSERGTDNCADVTAIKRSSSPFAGDCVASVPVKVPSGAIITALEGIFFMSPGSNTGDCGFRLTRDLFQFDSSAATLGLVEGQGGVGDSFDIATMNTRVVGDRDAFTLYAFSTTTSCLAIRARITYTLPDGFIP